MFYEIFSLAEIHINSVIEIAEACGLSKRDSNQLQINSERNDYILLVSLQSDEVSGFIEAQIIADEIHLYDVAVAPEFRRQGIAESLIGKLEEFLSSAILLEVRESNLAALQLYKKCGFVADGIRKNYYSAPVENAVLMSRKIS
jgi:[ribosomal protein S18]-alanine N-acetyltransferase